MIWNFSNRRGNWKKIFSLKFELKTVFWHELYFSFLILIPSELLIVGIHHFNSNKKKLLLVVVVGWWCIHLWILPERWVRYECYNQAMNCESNKIQVGQSLKDKNRQAWAVPTALERLLKTWSPRMVSGALKNRLEVSENHRRLCGNPTPLPPGYKFPVWRSAAAVTTH